MPLLLLLSCNSPTATVAVDCSSLTAGDIMSNNAYAIYCTRMIIALLTGTTFSYTKRATHITSASIPRQTFSQILEMVLLATVRGL